MPTRYSMDRLATVIAPRQVRKELFSTRFILIGELFYFINPPLFAGISPGPSPVVFRLRC